jgi:hypothetical protein
MVVWLQFFSLVVWRVLFLCIFFFRQVCFSFSSLLCFEITDSNTLLFRISFDVSFPSSFLLQHHIIVSLQTYSCKCLICLASSFSQTQEVFCLLLLAQNMFFGTTLFGSNSSPSIFLRVIMYIFLLDLFIPTHLCTACCYLVIGKRTKKKASNMFVFGNRAVCSSCRRPLWRCLCRLPFVLLPNLGLLDSNPDVTIASGAGTLLRSAVLEETCRKRGDLLDYWTLKASMFALRDRLRFWRKYNIVCLSVGRLQLFIPRSEDPGSKSSFGKAEVETQRFEINRAVH